MNKKEFLINAVRMIDIEGNKNIPTVLYYARNGTVLIGSSALVAARNRHEINEDFKVDLGNINPTSSAPREMFDTASGRKKSAVGLTGDFLNELLQRTSQWLENNDVAEGTSILLAEPLAMQEGIVGSDWLANYRRNLERLLAGKKFESIDFLPEPFAVFQYYRHGLRHPLLAERTKQHALVIDFGGGTYDVCIIETTKEGDISQTGRNSRPLAAASEPVGGFYINRMIAEELFRKCSSSSESKRKLAEGLRIYEKWRKAKDEFSPRDEQYRHFVHNFHETIYKVENHKLALCKHITNWGLEAPPALTVPIDLPENPFSPSEKLINLPFSASDLRDIFIRRVWEQHLKPITLRALQRGREELRGATISVVLLSGGSANIGWLRELLRRDFDVELGDAEILQLPDFQEVVAKGLAVECARRFFNQEGDFSSVTYNRLCLILDPDDTGYQLKPFIARQEGLPNVTDMPGVLLPSASILKNFIEKPMRWRVKLDRAPHRQLSYYFLRSSFDPNDINNLQNVEGRSVNTPRDCSFDNALKVELIVSQDGTAKPRFVYKSGRTEEETIAANGRPFYLDTTYGQTVAVAKGYIGLDFGTSNTSISFVDGPSIQIYQKRSAEKFWRELSDLTSTLPYPLAEPLGRYLGQSDKTKLAKLAFEFIEAALTLAAYISYLDYCAHKGRGVSNIFKGFTQRSAGPLWALLNECLKRLGDKTTVSAPFKDLLIPELNESISKAVSMFALYKHDMASDTSVDTLRPVQILANVSQKLFVDYIFGFFEQVQKRRFAKDYQGLYRRAEGVPPFIKVFDYRGQKSFSNDEAYLLNSQEDTALSLQPLIFWDQCSDHPDLDTGHCYLYNKPGKEDGEFSFKAVGYPCVCHVSLKNDYSDLAKTLEAYRNADPKIEFLQVRSNASQNS